MITVRGFPASQGTLDFDVSPGDIILLRGPNGSGKTSLLRALAGLTSPLSPQSLRVADVDPARASASQMRARARLSPQDAQDALAGLTVAGEFRLRGAREPEDLSWMADRESRTLSSGEARRVALALAEDAPLLLLDEPAEGLDAEGRARLVSLVKRTAQKGAVIAADHGHVLADVATRVIELGRAVLDPLPPIPKADGPIILHAPAARVRDIDLPAIALGPGFHALRGSNGSGKSTLLCRLAGIESSDGVRIRDAPPVPGRTTRLLLPRAKDLLLRERVADEIGDGCGLVDDALLARHPLTLSGGEAQRVALAKTLGRRADCYLLDEPEAHLDAAGRVGLARLLAQRVAEGACILAATHDESLAALAQSEVRL